MQTQTQNQIKINIPPGFEIDTLDKQAGVISFKPVPQKVTDRIKTISDVLNDQHITEKMFEAHCKGLSEDEVAYRILKFLASSLNEDWTPNWDNTKQSKYFPWFEMGGSSGFRFYVYVVWRSTSHVGSRICFKSRELAEYAGKQFTDVYKQFMLIK